MEQKKKKTPWRFAFGALAAVSSLKLLGYLATWLMTKVYGGLSFPVRKAASIGIIGGADGPTAIFVTAATDPAWEMLLWLLLLAAGIWGFLRLNKQK